jgi:type IV secretion system protein VirB10
MGEDRRQAEPEMDAPVTLQAEAGPLVARPRARGLPVAVAGTFIVAAILLFLTLNGRRGQAEAHSLVTPVAGAAPGQAAPPLETPPAAAEPLAPPTAPEPRPPVAPAAQAPPPGDALERRRAPMMVVDIPRPISAVADRASGADPKAADGSVDALAQQLGGGPAGPETAVAHRMGNLQFMIPQGAIIPAVLETGIDSDLPGYARAIVSRDVSGFDATTVLIPRGSRVIGRYRSATAQGQSRVFVIWSRIIRPDGASIQIASPAADALGRGGLSGEVDRHFFTRFSGSILLSVLNSGLAALGRRSSTEIAIGSSVQAGAVGQPDAIAPTIRVAQGETVRIFVARDLDFTGVGAAR